MRARASAGACRARIGEPAWLRPAKPTRSSQSSTVCRSVFEAGDAGEKRQIFAGGEIFVNADAVAEKTDRGALVAAARRFAENADAAALMRDSPARMRRSVVFPAPLRPSSAQQEPWPIFRV